MAKVHIDSNPLLMYRFSLTEELRTKSVSNTYTKVIELKDDISEIDEQIDTINKLNEKEIK